MGISVYELALAIKVPRSRANDIVRGRRAITTDTAIRLGRYFGMTAEFWINLQARYNLDVGNRTLRRRERDASVYLPQAPGRPCSIPAIPRSSSRSGQ